MLPPFKPLPEDLQAFHAKRRADVYPLVPRYSDLRDRLLRVGGVEVVFPKVHERGRSAVMRQCRDVELVLPRGRTFSTEGLTLEPMAASQCHVNVAQLFAAGRGRIGMGWSLSDDGVWREHSWIVSAESTDASAGIVETTLPRLVYFGVELDDAEAKLFAQTELGREASNSRQE